MANLCQDDFYRVRPDQYFPETYRMGECDACYEQTFVARVTADEAADAKAKYDDEVGSAKQETIERIAREQAAFEDAVRREREYDDGFIRADDH